MDPATLIGLVLAFGSLYAMVTIEGAHVQSLLLPAPMILVFGATIAVGLASGTLKDALSAAKSVIPALTGKPSKLQDSIEHLTKMAETARAQGLLSMEAEATATDDPFLKKALQNIADGTDGDDLRTLLEDEIAARHKAGHMNSKFFSILGGFAPTVGIIGTVVSLTHVLENLSDPANLGPMIASAFVATLWGLLSSNFIWLPIAGRIGRLNDLTTERMNLQMEGIMAIQEGVTPILLGERLNAMISSGEAKPAKTKTKPSKADK